jgi:4-amino-4-deoxy-L-arabinose transferase-like glycosyltransferase
MRGMLMPRAASLGAVAIPLAIYLASAYRDVMYWDIGEMDTVPYILGIAHPPGYPLYTLTGWVFTHAMPLGSVAFRMSALSALALAATCWFVWRIVVDGGGDALAGLCAALLFAFSEDTWAHATRAEPHALVALAAVALLCFLLRWLAHGRTRDLCASALALGLGIAVHPVVALTLPGVLVAVVARAHQTDARVLRRAAVIAVAAAAVWFCYLPLRSAYVNAERVDPLASYGIVGSAFWNYDDPVLVDNFVALVTGREIGIENVRYGYTAHAFTRGFAHFVPLTVRELTPIGCALAIAGLIVLFRRNTVRAIVMAATLLPSALFAFGFAAESDVDRYFLPAFALFAIAAGEALARLRPVRIHRTGLAFAGLAILYLTFSQPHFFDQPHDDRAARDAAEILRATPSNAMIIATWVVAPPLAYDDYVLAQTGARVIVPSWYGEQIDRVPQWVRAQPVFVAGTPQGSVPGYHLERMPTQTELYRVEVNR